MRHYAWMFLLLIGCTHRQNAMPALTQLITTGGTSGGGGGNSAPVSVVVDGQSNGNHMPTADLIASFAKVGLTDVTVTNIAVSSTFLREHMQGGAYYAATQTVIKTKPAIYIWWQGEAEATFGTGVNTYEQDMVSFFNDLRAQGGDFKIILIELTKNGIVSQTPWGLAVRQAQDSLFLPNLKKVTIDDLTPFDGYHFSAADYQTVSNRIAEAATS